MNCHSSVNSYKNDNNLKLSGSVTGFTQSQSVQK